MLGNLRATGDDAESVASIAIHIGRSKKADDSSSDVEQVGDTDRVYDAGDVDMGGCQVSAFQEPPSHQLRVEHVKRIRDRTTQ
ncbi:hypothetical protein GQ600_18080 [Phytophthora cactorum]|nr:hypothetical protein GQ600_18080 [Phytophthora cactorum]